MRLFLSCELAAALLAWTCANSSASTPTRPVISTEGNIAKVTARILEKSQYAHHPLDDEIAGKFLDRYVEELDGQHLTFFQSDLEEFAPYRNTLDELTKAGNTNPAHAIYDRFLHRLEQRVTEAT